MLKIAFLSGAYKNAGDFLIEERSIKLIQYFIQDISMDKFFRNELFGECEKLNDYDAIIIGGGPIYSQNIEQYLPIEEMIHVIEKPIMIIGGGWYGTSGGYQQVYDYRFSKLSKKFLEAVDKDGFGLSCRDLYTYRTLRKEGYQNVWITGCPAWYNLDTLKQSTLRENSAEIRSIVISDPARESNFETALSVVQYLREYYPEAKITFLFHRGITPDKFTPQSVAESTVKLKKSLQPYCDDILDISYGGTGFSIYDTCDLHVGFRVHAHIYCLSMRNRSILIEEDGRGAGVNQILGIPSLKAYSDCIQTNNTIYMKVKRKLNLFAYHHVVEDLCLYLEILQATGDLYFENAFRSQQNYFRLMGNFISRLNSKSGGKKE